MSKARKLGSQGFSGDPLGDAPIEPSPMNVVWAFGLFPRRFANPQIMVGTIDSQFILGDAQSGKLSWHTVNDAMQKVKPKGIEFHLLSFIGSGAAQAKLTVKDQTGGSTPVTNLFGLEAAYRSNVSKGVWDNDTAIQITYVYPASATIAANSLSGATTLFLNSVVGLRVGGIVEIIHSATSYGFKITSIDENARSITGVPDTAGSAFTIGDVVKLKYFTIQCFRRDHRGQISQIATPFDDVPLSMEPEDVASYLPTVLANHPLFVGVDKASPTDEGDGWLLRFPAEISGSNYDYLTGGLNGTDPAGTSDWTSLQATIALYDRGIFAVMSAESTSAAVHKSYEAFCKSLQSHPMYVASLPYFGSDWQSLEAASLPFIKRQNWVQFLNVYGWRYVPDPVGDSGAVVQIPVHGGVLGKWIQIIYSGYVHRAVAETRFILDGYVDGPAPVAEDPFSAKNPAGWTDEIRTALYNAGVNIVQNVPGFGVILRNFRTPSDDVRVRDAHIHAINQLIKFTSEFNFQTSENVPNQWPYLQKVAGRIGEEIMKPLFEGNFPPYCVDRDTGAFRKTKSDNTPAEWFDVAQVQADEFNNPQSQFDQGDANLAPTWVPYSLLRSLWITVATAVKIFK